MDWLSIIHMPCNCMLLAVIDTISHTHVIWIDPKSNTLYVQTELLVIHSTFGGISDHFLQKHNCCLFLNLFLLENPPAPPFLHDNRFSWLINISLDKWIWDPWHHDIVLLFCFKHDCCLMGHGWTGSFIFCYVVTLCASIWTSSCFDLSTSFLHQIQEAFHAFFVTVVDILSILLGRNHLKQLSPWFI